MSITAPPPPHTPPGSSPGHRSPRGDAAPAPAPVSAPVADHDGHEDLPTDLRKPNPLIVIAVGLIFLVLLAALFVLGYLPHLKAQEQIEADAKLVTDVSSLVAVTHPTPAVGAKEVKLPCDIRPNQETAIFPRASGYLKTLYVDINDHVTKDQVLAEIDAPEVDAQLVQAQAALKQAQADVAKARTDHDLAQRTYDRLSAANAAGSQISQQELDERSTARNQSQDAVNQALANADSAQANIKRLQVLQGFDKITAPFAGVITTRNYDVGALLSPTSGRELFHLEQSDTLRVFVNMPQVYATEIHTGQTADLTVRNYGMRKFTGTITRTADAISATTRTMPFEIQFPNQDRALVPGMYGEVRIAVDSPPQAFLIPVSSMLFDAAGTQVATVVDGKVHLQPVVVGRDLGKSMEVLSGVDANTVIITNPGERLAEGDPVKVAPEE